MPVSALAIGVNAILIALTFADPARPNVRRMILVGGMILCGAAVWFTVIQAAIIHHLCPWCISTHVINVVAGGLLIQMAAPRLSNRPVALFGNTALAAGLLVVFIAIQLWQPTHDMKIVDIPSDSSPKPPATEPERWILEYDGKFKLPISELPLLGSPNSRSTIVTLYDYCCPHCRKMHALLKLLVQGHHNELAVIALPMPLCDVCNIYVVSTQKGYENSCVYARLALEVFRADPSQFAAFDDWMWVQASLPSPAAAQGYAAQLVGEKALAVAAADPWVAKQLTMDIDLYASNSRQASSWRLPQVMVGKGVAVGMPDDPQHINDFVLAPLSK